MDKWTLKCWMLANDGKCTFKKCVYFSPYNNLFKNSQICRHLMAEIFLFNIFFLFFRIKIT